MYGQEAEVRQESRDGVISGGGARRVGRFLSDDAPATTAYCEYGALSEAQLQGCIDHVTVDDFDRLNTNAARYARGELDKCRRDAGPFCE